MYIVFEYSLLALWLFFFGLIGFWMGIENTKKIRGLFYESREPKESFLFSYFGRIFAWIFMGGFGGYTFFYLALRFHLRNHEAVLKAFSVSELKEELGEEWAILIRLHPTISDSGIIKNLGEDVYDVSFYEDVKELYEVSDVLVNDYSSTAVEYALLRKPIVCFVPDFDKYDRGFYRDYEENAVGEIVKDFSGLLSAIRQGKSDDAELDGFLKLHYDYFDSNNRGRILDILYR